MERSPITAHRLLPLLATLAALIGGVDAGWARTRADPAARDTTSSGFEARVEALIHGWFAVLGDPALEVNRLNPLLAEPRFELILDGVVLHDRSAVSAWASDLRATYSRIEYRLDPIRIRAESPDLYRVEFEVDRRALDGAGISHVARRKHTWILQRDPRAIPLILRIEEQPLLFYSGTGPQVVCY